MGDDAIFVLPNFAPINISEKTRRVSIRDEEIVHYVHPAKPSTWYLRCLYCETVVHWTQHDKHVTKKVHRRKLKRAIASNSELVSDLPDPLQELLMDFLVKPKRCRKRIVKK